MNHPESHRTRTVASRCGSGIDGFGCLERVGRLVGPASIVLGIMACSQASTLDALSDMSCWTRLPDPPSSLTTTTIISAGENEYVVAITEYQAPALYRLSMKDEGGTYSALPFSKSLTSTCYGGNFSGFTTLASALIGGRIEVFAGSGRTISRVNLDPAETAEVLQPIMSWCWDPSYLGRVVHGRCGYYIANYGAASGFWLIDLETGKEFRLADTNLFRRETNAGGVDVYYLIESQAPTALLDQRGLAWTDDVRIQLGYTKYSFDGGNSWIAYEDETRESLSFSSKSIDESGGFLFGNPNNTREGRMLAVAKLDAPFHHVRFPRDVIWTRVDALMNRLFVATEDGLYVAPVADVIRSIEPPRGGSKADFDGDGRPDLVFQFDAVGSLAYWSMEGATQKSSGLLPPVDPAWRLAGTADVNNDSATDLFFQRRNDGTLAVWYMRGVSRIGSELIQPPSAGQNWRLAAVTDVDSDGNGDLLLQEVTEGTVAVWYMEGSRQRSTSLLRPSNRGGVAWQLAGSGDLDGDGRAELIWRHNEGWVAAWIMQGEERVAATYLTPGMAGRDWEIGAVTDVDLDGRVDLVFRHVDGLLAIWMMDGVNRKGATLTAPAWIGQWHLAGPR